MSIWNWLARRFSGEATPLLGKAVADRANKHGIAYLMPYGFPHPGRHKFDPTSKQFADLQLPSAVHRLLNDSDQYARVIGSPQELGKDFQGVLLNVGGAEISPAHLKRLAGAKIVQPTLCLLYTSPSPRDS